MVTLQILCLSLITYSYKLYQQPKFVVYITVDYWIWTKNNRFHFTCPITCAFLPHTEVTHHVQNHRAHSHILVAKYIFLQGIVTCAVAGEASFSTNSANYNVKFPYTRNYSNYSTQGIIILEVDYKA